MSTSQPDPRSTESAESVRTRVGELDFELGLPTEETVAKLYDELDFQRACQAYIWALPLVGMATWQRANYEAFGARDCDIVLYRTYRDKLGILTPNATTPYIVSFVNLTRSGPVVVDLPAGPNASGIADFWQRSVVELGQTGHDKGRGGKYLVSGPEGSAPDAPADYTAVRSATVNVWPAFRALDADPTKAQQWIDKVRIYPYAERDNPPQQRHLSPGGTTWQQAQPRGLAFWELLANIIDQEVVQERDRVTMAMLNQLGIEKGKPFAPDARQKRILNDAVFVGESMAKANSFAKRFAGVRYRPDAHWDYVMVWDWTHETPFYHQLDELAAYTYEATGTGPGMVTKTPGVGQAYLGCYRDATGHAFDGTRTYRLRVPPNAPAKNFWSLTLYDLESRSFIDNEHEIADRSSRMNLKANDDGSVDIYCAPGPPPGFEPNWIPTVPGRAWFAYFRLYGPTESYFDRSYALPDLERL
jgi:hypothetical protein